MIEDSLKNGESPEFTGKCIVALAADPKIAKKSGKCLFTADIAREYGFKDIDGERVGSSGKTKRN